MQLVRENINFERGLDPKEAMGIGNHVYRAKVKIKKVLEELVAEFGGRYKIIKIYNGKILDGIYYYENNLKPIKFDIWYSFREDKKEVFWFVFPAERRHSKAFTHHSKGAEGIMLSVNSAEEAKEKIRKWVLQNPKTSYDITESVNFERGLDPKASMGIGKARPRDVVAEIEHESDGSSIYIIVGNKERKLNITNKYADDPNLLWNNIEKIAWKMGAGNIHDSESEPDLWEISPKNRIIESINFERGQDPKKALNIGLLKFFENKGVRLWFGWGNKVNGKLEGELEKEKVIENIKEIKEYFDLLVKNGVDPKEMELSHHDLFRIKNYEVLDSNHVILNCLTLKHAKKIIQECKKFSIDTYGENFKIDRGESHIYFTEYMKKWLEDLIKENNFEHETNPKTFSGEIKHYGI